jgi:SsrA-binding protein
MKKPFFIERKSVQRFFFSLSLRADVMDNSNINIKNKKAWHEYFIDEEFIAGMVLKGTEIKSIRSGKVSLAESYCTFIEDELYVINMHISEYKFGTHRNHEPKTDRKLLLNRRELKKLAIKLKERGYTIIPLNLFINEKGLAKLRIGLARGKKMYDKRESLKEKDTQREIDRKYRKS